jgi:bifunctional ADP-heptose synthase (sugar kinase/adenylyltransferase)
MVACVVVNTVQVTTVDMIPIRARHTHENTKNKKKEKIKERKNQKKKKSKEKEETLFFTKNTFHIFLPSHLLPLLCPFPAPL